MTAITDREFAGKAVLVTGASKGIGAGIAKAFGEAGAHVAVAYARDRGRRGARRPRRSRRPADAP